ncbi:MAG: hypothetical protein U0746_10510 [Gemmataceae bacterium]
MTNGGSHAHDQARAKKAQAKKEKARGTSALTGRKKLIPPGLAKAKRA